MSADLILEVQAIHSFYDKSHVLQGISFAVKAGEVVTLLGRNGAGKTTTLKSISGIVKPSQGHVLFQGVDMVGSEPYQIAAKGVCLVPENRGIIPAC